MNDTVKLGKCYLYTVFYALYIWGLQGKRPAGNTRSIKIEFMSMRYSVVSSILQSFTTNCSLYTTVTCPACWEAWGRIR